MIRLHVGLAELQADDCRHEIELGDRHQAPVEATDHEQNTGKEIKLLHLSHLRLRIV